MVQTCAFAITKDKIYFRPDGDLTVSALQQIMQEVGFIPLYMARNLQKIVLRNLEKGKMTDRRF